MKTFQTLSVIAITVVIAWLCLLNSKSIAQIEQEKKQMAIDSVLLAHKSLSEPLVFDKNGIYFSENKKQLKTHIYFYLAFA